MIVEMDFEQRSFENMVNFYALELKQINEGVHPSKFFNTFVLSSFTQKKGLLTTIRGPVRKYRVSPEALTILNNGNKETLTEKEVEEITFRNTIYNNKDELLQIIEGENATNLFPLGFSKKLYDRGILTRDKGAWRGIRYRVSSAALEVLNGVNKL